MTISATEFKTNFGKYLNLVQKEDIEITKNGKIIGIFSNPLSKDVEAICGVLNGTNYDKKQLREMYLEDKYGNND